MCCVPSFQCVWCGCSQGAQWLTSGDESDLLALQEGGRNLSSELEKLIAQAPAPVATGNPSTSQASEVYWFSSGFLSVLRKRAYHLSSRLSHVTSIVWHRAGFADHVDMLCRRR